MVVHGRGVVVVVVVVKVKKQVSVIFNMRQCGGRDRGVNSSRGCMCGVKDNQRLGVWSVSGG